MATRNRTGRTNQPQQTAASNKPAAAPSVDPTPVGGVAVIDDGDDSEFDDLEIDQEALIGYGDGTPIEGQGEGIVLLDEPEEPEEDDSEIVPLGLPPEQRMTTTSSFMGDRPNSGGVRKLAKQERNLDDPDAKFIVRVSQDFGPVFVGARKIQLSKDTRYQVDRDIYIYLKSRKGLLVGE